MMLEMIIMNCRRVNGMISAYVDSELSGMDMLAVRRHLTDCDECRHEYDSILELKRAFGGLTPKKPSDGFTSRIFMHLDEVSIPFHRRIIYFIRQRLFIFPPKLRLVTSGLVVIAVLLAFSGGYMGDKTQTANQPMPYSASHEAFFLPNEFSSMESSVAWKEDAPIPWGPSKKPISSFSNFSNTNLWLVDF